MIRVGWRRSWAVFPRFGQIQGELERRAVVLSINQAVTGWFVSTSHFESPRLLLLG